MGSYLLVYSWEADLNFQSNTPIVTPIFTFISKGFLLLRIPELLQVSLR